MAWTGTEALSWRDLWVIVNQAPQGSALDRAMRPDEALWGLPEQLLANISDGINVLAWQNSKDAHSQSPQHYPEPTPRPGVEPRTKARAGVPIDEMRKRLGLDKTA